MKITKQKLHILSTYIWKGKAKDINLIKEIIDKYEIVSLTNEEKSILKLYFDKLYKLYKSSKKK